MARVRNLANLLVMMLALGCARPERTKREARPVASTSTPVSTPTVSQRARREPDAVELLRLPLAAFHVTLVADEDAIYLLTTQGAYRFEPDRPPRHFALDLGEGPVMTRSSFVYWSRGAIWRTPKLGGEPQPLASVPHKPQYFATSGDYFVWLDRTDQGQCTIRTLDAQKQRVIYKATGEIDAVAMVNDWAFFAERAEGSGWRLGGIRRGGGDAAYSTLKQGRSPAMLVADRDNLFYYDINRIEFRKMSSDLHNEEVVQTNFVCSPIAVSERIHCGQVEGLVELPRKPPYLPRLLAPGARTPITTIAANTQRVAWVVDVGANNLAVRALPITGNE
jgi:hypothetical protein